MSNFDRLQGAAGHCVHSKAVLGCLPCLERVKRQAGMYLRDRDSLLTALQGEVERLRDLYHGRRRESDGGKVSYARAELYKAQADRLQQILDTYGGGE